MTKFLIILVLSVLTIGCQKDKVNKRRPEMIGDWVHVTGQGNYFTIYIQPNGRGFIYEETTNNDGLDTQGRVWLIKDGKLRFSRFNREEFTIDEYPTTANALIINNYDTIKAGQIYMVLDGNYFRKK